MRVRGSLASLVGAACWGWEGRDGAFEHVRTSWVTRLWVPSGWGGTWRVAPVRLAARTEGRSGRDRRLRVHRVAGTDVARGVQFIAACLATGHPKWSIFMAAVMGQSQSIERGSGGHGTRV